MKNLLIAVLIFLSSCGIGYGATSYTASTCSRANVATAITSCGNDAQCTQVNIPAGNCSSDWTSVISIPKAMKIQGAGSSNTILTSDGAGFFGFGSSGTEITGIGFNMGPGVFIQVWGGQNWRIHHNSFTGIVGGLGQYAIQARTNNFSNPPYGLIDNNQFIQNTRIFAGRCMDSAWNCNVEAYYETTNLGSSSFIFIEDNTATFSADSNNWIDSNDAGRYVARFNTLTNTEIMCHGVGYETGRGEEQEHGKFIITLLPQMGL